MTHAGNTYLLSVDYGRSVKDGVIAGYYDGRIDADIVYAANFPTEREGTAEVEMKLIHFDRDISTEEVLRELDRMGYRPADIYELLALGEKYRGVQWGVTVVALGSVWFDGKCHYVPFISFGNEGRYLGLCPFKCNWHKEGRERFAAVKK
jgi:hypothetical protein